MRAPMQNTFRRQGVNQKNSSARAALGDIEILVLHVLLFRDFVLKAVMKFVSRRLRGRSAKSSYCEFGASSTTQSSHY